MTDSLFTKRRVSDVKMRNGLSIDLGSVHQNSHMHEKLAKKLKGPTFVMKNPFQFKKMPIAGLRVDYLN